MKSKRLAFTVLITACLFVSTAVKVIADESPVRSAEEILAGQETNPSREAIRELFVNGSSRDERHAPVAAGCKQALINLGMLAIPPLLEDYLPSDDLLFSIALDQIVSSAGHPATEYLIPWLQSADSYTRRHAASLIGAVSEASKLEDPTALGPLDGDLTAITALKDALSIESDWHVIRSLLEALGAMRDSELVEVIAGYLSNEEQAVRLSAAAALGRIPDRHAATVIMTAFADEEMTVRETAVLALSTPVMGNIAFDDLMRKVSDSGSGSAERLCALEGTYRFLESNASDPSVGFVRQRVLAFRRAADVAGNETGPEGWILRGYAVAVIGVTWEPSAPEFLENMRTTENHPFVLQKIEEALSRLAEGQPLPAE
jgi:hypothetical protein